MSVSADQQKQNAARSAVHAHVKDGMCVGLGTGSTAKHAVDFVADLVDEKGWKLTVCTTSEVTEKQAISRGLVTVPLSSVSRMQVAIDGADEIDTSALALIKGGGGALLREKYVEIEADKFVVIADSSKTVDILGKGFKLPVEVVKFGWEKTSQRILSSFPWIKLQRRETAGDPFVTDEGHFILDLDFSAHGIADPASVAKTLKSTIGVVEHGLFLDMAVEVHLGNAEGGVDIIAGRDKATVCGADHHEH